MLNRDAFNRFLRRQLDEQYAAIVAMSNDELVQKTLDDPRFAIHVVIYDALRFFKIETTHRGCGSVKDVIKWLGEAAESTTGKRING